MIVQNIGCISAFEINHVFSSSFACCSQEMYFFTMLSQVSKDLIAYPLDSTSVKSMFQTELENMMGKSGLKMKLDAPQDIVDDPTLEVKRLKAFVSTSCCVIIPYTGQ